MDEKMWEDLEEKWHDLFQADKTELMFSEWMYYQGCAAQSAKDREAVVEQWKSIRTFPLWEDHVVLQGFEAALAAAAIVEEK